MLYASLLLPFIAGIAAFFMRSKMLLRTLLGTTAVGHAIIVFLLAWSPPAAMPDSWLNLDETGLLFLGITSGLFLVTSFYTIGYLNRETSPKQDFEENVVFSNEPEAFFIGCLILLLASMTLAAESQHMGILWVGIETTTVISAPLIFFHRHHRSLEAAWKYLLICSIGIGFALLGNLFLAVSAIGNNRETVSLVLGDILALSENLNHLWLKAAFVFLFFGYGIKMGLAPMHTWLPGAHAESPSPVSALLSGSMLNCAFLGILRAHQIALAAGEGAFAGDILVAFGLVSMFVAATFILNQTDFKRLLAYSSIEHMGILALGMGLGGVSAYGALLHTINHSVVKASLFLVAGNLLRIYKTKTIGKVRGILQATPVSGILWVTGFIAIAGFPPFGVFISKFTILRGAINQGHYMVAAAYLVLLGVVFIGMSSNMLSMTQGNSETAATREPLSAIIPPALLITLSLGLGIYLPPFLTRCLDDAARALGGP